MKRDEQHEAALTRWDEIRGELPDLCKTLDRYLWSADEDPRAADIVVQLAEVSNMLVLVGCTGRPTKTQTTAA
jgi:hypothetical protein